MDAIANAPPRKAAREAALLNEAQREAVFAEGHVLVSACPGSGKTKTLEERVNYLLGKDPRIRVAGVTFTREAAQSLQARITARTPGASARLEIGTFHAQCIRQLRAAKRLPRFIQEPAARQLMLRGFLALGKAVGEEKFEDVYKTICDWKARLNPLLPANPADVTLQVYTRYHALMSQRGECDLQDLLLNTVRGMRAGEVKPLEASYLVVDEFQDTDAVQLAWIQAHIEHGLQVTVVGDDDQSVYSFRHALGYEGMEQFRTSNRAQHITLGTSYRCAAEVLAPAARLISFNIARMDKHLRTENKRPGLVRVCSALNIKEEAEMVCVEIARSIAQDRAEPKDWAVITRTNAQIDALELAVRGRFGYHRSGGRSFWDARGPHLLCTVLSSLENDQLPGIESLLHKCEAASASTQALLSLHAHKDNSISAFVRMPPKVAAADKPLFDRTREACARWLPLLADGSHGAVNKVILGVAHFIDLHATLYPHRSEKDRAADRAVMLSASQSLQQLHGPLRTRLRLLETQRADAGHAVSFLTLHAAKGLEFPRVWLPGCNQGVLPDKRADIEEERRLMYVGMTRAQQVLVLSYTSQETGNGKTSEVLPSEFLEQAGVMEGRYRAVPGPALAYPCTAGEAR